MPCQCQQKTNRATKPQPATPAFISMRYTGPTSAVATGASGRHYKFGRTGATIKVDARDKAALARIPHLRQI